MACIIDDLKAQARILQRRATAGDAAARARLAAAGVKSEPIKRADCLRALARELGFDGWPHLFAVIGDGAASDFGTLLYPSDCGGTLNIWSSSYEEARDIRPQHGGCLLAYKRLFVIVDRCFIETLGLDADDPDWQRIGRDWVRPADRAARERLYEKLVRVRQQAVLSGGV